MASARHAPMPGGWLASALHPVVCQVSRRTHYRRHHRHNHHKVIEKAILEQLPVHLGNNGLPETRKNTAQKQYCLLSLTTFFLTVTTG